MPQHVFGIHEYPVGQSAEDAQSCVSAQRLSSQQKHCPSVLWLQYAAPNGPHPMPHCWSEPPHVQLHGS
jgi:hypothetical protein